MRARYASVLALALATPVLAAPPEIDIPAEVTPSGDYATVVPKTTAVSVRYVPQSGISAFPSEFLKDPRAFVLPVRGRAPGRYEFTAVGASKTGEQADRKFAVVVGKAPPGPNPPGPTPPDPPGPKPPTPDPPSPSVENPFGAAPGLRVMIVYESADESRMPAGQFLVLRGAKFRDYLDANCAPDGYRILDKDVKFQDPGTPWEAAMKRADRKSLPWLYAGKEASGLSAPLPADPDATIAAVNKFLGK
jgi:hypothetical protein